MLTRRQILNASLVSLAALAVGDVLQTRLARAANGDNGDVVTYTDAEWRKLLSADQYAVLRESGT